MHQALFIYNRPNILRYEISACAICHWQRSRRIQLFGPYLAISDSR